MNNINQETRSVQLDDIARKLGISKTTVSRAISGKGRVSEKTREKVLDCIRVMNYSPNMTAKSFSEKKTYNIGVVIPMDNMETEAPFFQTCLMGITKCCALRNYDTLVISAERNDVSQLRRVLEGRKTDGIIITRPLQNGNMEQLITDMGVPYVTVGQSSDMDAVTIDSAHKEGCFELTSYLLMNNKPEKLGLIIGSMEQTVNRSRYEGFVRAVESAGSLVPTKTVFLGVNGELQLRRVIDDLLQRECGCIICGDDMICMYVVNMLAAIGRMIPRDIRVASLYNSMYLDMYSPPITALNFRASDLGATAANLLLDMLEGKDTSRETMLGFEMLIRKSTM
ncbi:MAG: LacI family DNA-binding transcriptional regulator [Ruminiclostridium sp.]|nr:LacI family DNA-binding transcriptional regulator [Ruminiclostridium sp.]